MRRSRQRSGTVALEFAIIAVPFLAVLLLVFELSWDLFTQSVLDGALQTAAREVQTGNAQNKTGTSFMNDIMCPDLYGLLACANVHVTVQSLAPTQDYFTLTGTPPVTNGQLTSGYSSGNFCNGGPSELLLVSAVYLGPSFLGSLMSNSLSAVVGGQSYHLTIATVGIASEAYAPLAAPPGSAPPC